ATFCPHGANRAGDSFLNAAAASALSVTAVTGSASPSPASAGAVAGSREILGGRFGPAARGPFNLEGNREGRGAVYDSEARYAGNGEFDSDPRLQPPIAHCHVIPAMRAVLFGPLALSRASRGR